MVVILSTNEFVENSRLTNCWNSTLNSIENLDITYPKEFSEAIEQVIHEDKESKLHNRNNLTGLDASPKINKAPSFKRKIDQYQNFKNFDIDHEVEGGDDENDLVSNIYDDQNKSIQKSGTSNQSRASSKKYKRVKVKRSIKESGPIDEEMMDQIMNESVRNQNEGGEHSTTHLIKQINDDEIALMNSKDKSVNLAKKHFDNKNENEDTEDDENDNSEEVKGQTKIQVFDEDLVEVEDRKIEKVVRKSTYKETNFDRLTKEQKQRVVNYTIDKVKDLNSCYKYHGYAESTNISKRLCDRLCEKDYMIPTEEKLITDNFAEINVDKRYIIYNKKFRGFEYQPKIVREKYNISLWRVDEFGVVKTKSM